MKRKKAYYSISAVAEMFSVHQQTIRLYEKQGLINPKRSEGNTRLFTEEDVDRLEEVIHLTHQLGINLAGVEMILKLKKQIAKMQKDMNQLFERTQQELEQENEQAKQEVKKKATRLMELKQQTIPMEKAAPKEQKETEKPEPVDIDSWEIEYED